MNNTEIDKKIKEFFFDPGQSVKKYYLLYSYNNRAEKIIRFSPLYLARRDIYYCFGLNPEISKKIDSRSNFGPAIFAGVWLIYETIIILADSIEMEKEDFFKKYLEIKNSDNIVALTKLRNAITHINYGLRIRDRNVLWQFSLSPKSRYLIRKQRKSIYPSNNFVVNPFIFHKRLELGITALKKRLLYRRNRELRQQFNSRIRRKHWVIIY